MAYSFFVLLSMGYISIFIVLVGDLDFVFIPQGCVFSTLDASLDKLFGLKCYVCGIATLVILGLWVPSLPLRYFLILMIFTRQWSNLFLGLCKSYLLVTTEYQARTPLFLLKKIYIIFANDFITYIEIPKLGLLYFWVRKQTKFKQVHLRIL